MQTKEKQIDGEIRPESKLKNPSIYTAEYSAVTNLLL